MGAEEILEEALTSLREAKTRLETARSNLESAKGTVPGTSKNSLESIEKMIQVSVVQIEQVQDRLQEEDPER